MKSWSRKMKNKSWFFKIVFLFVCSSVVASEVQCSYQKKAFESVWVYIGTTAQELLKQFDTFPKNKKPTKILTTKISVQTIVEYLQKQENLYHAILESLVQDFEGSTFLHVACQN